MLGLSVKAVILVEGTLFFIFSFHPWWKRLKRVIMHPSRILEVRNDNAIRSIIFKSAKISLIQVQILLLNPEAFERRCL